MKLHGRTTQPEDLDQCLVLLRDRFLYREDQLKDLREMWFTLLSRDIGRSAVLFDEAEPRRILAFGISAALRQIRFDNILRDKAPFIARTLLDEWSSDRQPFLDEREYAFENASDGLNAFVLHNGISEVVNVLDLPNMLSRLSEAFITRYAGCRLRAIAHEPFGLPPEFGIDLGMQLIQYDPEHHRKIAECPADRRPSIVIMTREQAQRHPGNLALNALFLRFSPPRFSLNTIERGLLRFAVEGESDLRIADFLKIAPRTLKKRWGDIYLAMEPVTGARRGELCGHRGAEARRHVLRYIRQHPEELHAYTHPAVKEHGPDVAAASGTGRSYVLANGTRRPTSLHARRAPRSLPVGNPNILDLRCVP
jgi:hypothetical protein